MSTYEHNTLMTFKDAAGNLYILYPVTKAENIEGLDLEFLGAAPEEHKHTKSEITDFPSEMTPSSHKHSADDINGGTLSSERLPTVPISKGGTGATTEADALAKLGAAAATELAKYLLLAGGTLTDNLTISKATLASLILKTSEVGAALVQAGSNDLLLVSSNDDTWNNSRRIVIFNALGRSDVKMAAQLHNVVNGMATAYNLHGGHNKTSGTYTGNGSATSRTIATGGVGNVIFITSSKGTAILSNGSGIAFNSDGVVVLLYSAAHFIGGTLTSATTSIFVNASGVTYTYQVL